MTLHVITKPMLTSLRPEGEEGKLFEVKPSRWCRCCKNICEITRMYALLYHSRGRNCTTGIFILKTLSFMFRLSY